MLNSTHRPIISPFIGITFAAVSLTGILLLFHQKLPAVHEVHQWAGLLFVVGGIAHLILNWRPFAAYFKDTRALWGSLACVLTVALMVAFFPNKRDNDQFHSHDRGRGYQQYEQQNHHRW
jgi:hypothetical protein